MDDLAAARFLDSAVKTIEDFKPVYEHIRRFGDPERPMRILDFGCGLGRNIVGMLEHSIRWVVWGYDHPDTLERAKKFYGERLAGSDRLFLIDNWDAVMEQVEREKKRKFFDLIFACLVVQHIDPEELRAYLRDMARATKRLYVAGRRANDWNWSGDNFVSNWDIVAEFFEPLDLETGLAEGTNPHDHHYGIYKPKSTD